VGDRTTRCCSAVDRIAISAVLIVGTIARGIVAQEPDRTPVSLFPVRTAWTLALNNPLTVPPVYFGSHAYFAIGGDRLVAYDLTRGSQEWLVTADPQFEPAAGDGLLFISEPASLRAIRMGDGSTAWTLPAADPPAVAPVWDNGWLVLTTRGGEALAFRALDGHLVWRRSLGSHAHAQPSLAADRVYVPLADGRIVALRVETGEVVWERRLGGPATGLLALDERVYAGSNDNFFYALDASDGRVAWRWRTGADVVGVPVVDERNIYFVSLDNVLRALSRRTGVQQWARLLPLRPTRGPLKVEPTVIVSGIAPTLRAYNMANGTPAGELPAGGELAGPPYAVPATPAGLPRVLIVRHDVGKGATATLLTRQIDPPLTPFTPPPNAMKGMLETHGELVK
jgi:outer membrane protein assembly factor BamB